MSAKGHREAAVIANWFHRAFSRWITLNNALAGLFCASMNFIDSTRTTRPVMTFEPFGDHTSTPAEKLHLLHGTLPREVVCTENLTPFLKLLPCKGKAGISSLLDGHKLFDSAWQTMSIDVRPVCPQDQAQCIMEIEQNIDMVLDIERSKRPRGKLICLTLCTQGLIKQTILFPVLYLTKSSSATRREPTRTITTATLSTSLKPKTSP